MLKDSNVEIRRQEEKEQRKKRGEGRGQEDKRTGTKREGKERVYSRKMKLNGEEKR